MWKKYFDGHNMSSKLDNEFIRSLSYRPRKIILTESLDEEGELAFIKLNKGKKPWYRKLARRDIEVVWL